MPSALANAYTGPPPAHEYLDRLARGDLAPPPLQVESFEAAAGADADALVELAWRQRRFPFAVALATVTSERAFRTAVDRATRAAKALRAHPMVLLPWLSTERLEALETQGVSGLDLSGNGLVVVPGKLLVLRSGQPNAFPRSNPIRNIYAGDSSLVPRVFALRPAFAAVNDVHAEIGARGGKVALSTVSKALKSLEEDLIVARKPGAIRLLQPEKLLERLEERYEPPRLRAHFRGRTRLSREAFADALRAAAAKAGAAHGVVLTGAGSASRYAVLGSDATQAFYCAAAPDVLLRHLGDAVESTPRFANVELLFTADARVYFDARPEGGLPWASPLQTWLELATGDKRQQETAAQVTQGLLREIDRQLQETRDE